MGLNKILLNKFFATKIDFEIAGNNYHNFLSYCRDNNVSPNDEFAQNN